MNPPIRLSTIGSHCPSPPAGRGSTSSCSSVEGVGSKELVLSPKRVPNVLRQTSYEIWEGLCEKDGYLLEVPRNFDVVALEGGLAVLDGEGGTFGNTEFTDESGKIEAGNRDFFGSRWWR